jgi:hypothetical protein
MSNYDNLLRDKENNLPLENSDMEINWAAMETQLNSATQSTSKDATFNLQKIIKGLMVTAVVCIIAFVIFNTIKNKNIEKGNTNAAQLLSAIKPPMPAINVPYETFTYDAEIGDTMFTQNGSIIIFPKNAVLNNNGEIVKGKVEVRTREFNDPLDYYMAGIPMTYDSAGVKYNFVSSGMIDIKAYSNNELLKVNPNAKPQLNLVSTNNEKNTNLYILDTTTGQWINKGKDEVNDLAESNKQSTPIKTTLVQRKPIESKSVLMDEILALEGEAILKPLPPQKASGKNPTLEILIDPRSFKELLAYNNLKFEVLNSDAEKVEEDSKTEWEDVELLRSNDGSAKYIAKFSKGSKVVQYQVKPVLEGKDYDAAVNVYDEKIKAYYDVQKKRIANEQIQKDTLAFSEKIIDDENKKTVASNEITIAKNKITEIENKKIEELNVLIIARNKALKEAEKKYWEEVKRIDKRNDSLAAITKRVENDNRLVWEKSHRAELLKQNLIRSFELDGFGYWNCDMPTISNGVPLYVNFIDKDNKILSFEYINAVSYGVNRILAYYSNNITVLPNTNHAFWGIINNSFYYFTYKDYEELKINRFVHTQTFILKKYDGELNSITTLKKLLFNQL